MESVASWHNLLLAECLSDLWQRRFWARLIVNDADYCHINPRKHGLVERVADWPHSTFHRYVASGVYPVDWAGVTAANKTE